jgi:hypothetical protein
MLTINPTFHTLGLTLPIASPCCNNSSSSLRDDHPKNSFWLEVRCTRTIFPGAATFRLSATYLRPNIPHFIRPQN